MLLKLGNKELKVNTKTLQTDTSKSTGKEIEKISFNIKLRGEKAKSSFLNLLENSKDDVHNIDEKGNILKKYKIVNNSYSYTGQKPAENTLFNFTVELKEIEELKIESLIISGIEFFPYEYSEKFHNDALVIKAKVKSPSIQIDKLTENTKNKTYFPVIRKGISNEVKNMRFGKELWSKHDDTIKYALRLVDKSYDKNKDKFKGLFYPEMDNMIDLLAYIGNYIDELSELLIAKKILSAKEIESLNTKAKERLSEKISEFYRVKDIDL